MAFAIGSTAGFFGSLAGLGGGFIMIPLMPDGALSPEHVIPQVLLFFQWQTISFMYYEIGTALKEMQARSTKLLSGKKPTDYLKFFTLGKTEKKSKQGK